MELLITPDEIKRLGRPIGNVEESKIIAFIKEAEHMSVKPVIGDELYLKLLEKGDIEEDYKTLLNGGSYTDSRGNVFSFMGLRVAISYYVYAQNVMSGDFESTRYGMVFKDNDYSTRISSKERSDCYGNALEVANTYLKDCLQFCKEKGLIKRASLKNAKTGSIIIRKIG